MGKMGNKKEDDMKSSEPVERGRRDERKENKNK